MKTKHFFHETRLLKVIKTISSLLKPYYKTKFNGYVTYLVLLLHTYTVIYL